MKQLEYKWLAVLLLWFVCLLNYADRQAIFAVFPAVQTDLHLTDWQLGLVGSAFMWVYALIGPLAGWLGDRLSRKNIILGALLFWSLVTGATAYAHSFSALLVLRGLGGFGEAFYFPAAMSLLSDVHGAQTRSRAMSVHQTAVYAGSILGATASGYVADVHGWRSAFLVFGISGLFVSAALFAFLREPKRALLPTPVVAGRRHRFISDAGQLARNAEARLLIQVFMDANFVAVVFLTWMPSYLVRTFHLSLGSAGRQSSVFLQVASVGGVLVGGWLADQWIGRNPYGRMRTQALGLLCGVPFLLLLGTSFTLPAVVIGLTGLGFFKGIYDANIFAALHDVTAPEQRAFAAGVLNSLGWVAGGIAPLAIAWATRWVGFRTCLLATALLYLSAGVALAFTRRKSLKSLAKNDG